jgi:hypothetical protein
LGAGGNGQVLIQDNWLCSRWTRPLRTHPPPELVEARTALGTLLHGSFHTLVDQVGSGHPEHAREASKRGGQNRREPRHPWGYDRAAAWSRPLLTFTGEDSLSCIFGSLPGKTYTWLSLSSRTAGVTSEGLTGILSQG